MRMKIDILIELAEIRLQAEFQKSNEFQDGGGYVLACSKMSIKSKKWVAQAAHF